KQYLLKNGVRRVDYAIATHLDTDHYEGLRELANLKMLKSFGFYEGNKVIEDKLLKELDMKSNQLFYLKAGMNINIDRNLKLQVLWPKPKADYFSDYNNIDENQRSLVMKVIIDGVSFLISGDIGFETEEQLKGNLKADVLQIPHHGSPTSTGEEFLNKVNPKVGIIQVGQNNYGHPAKRVIDILEKKDIMMYRCDTGGGVGLFCHRGNFRVKQVIEGIQ
ncbi:MAG: MBL fold metallo-hydrolase, partial [Anaerovoracaceae bacterium]